MYDSDKATLLENKLWEMLDLFDEDAEGNIILSVEPEELASFIQDTKELLADIEELD